MRANAGMSTDTLPKATRAASLGEGEDCARDVGAPVELDRERVRDLDEPNVKTGQQDLTLVHLGWHGRDRLQRSDAKRRARELVLSNAEIGATAMNVTLGDVLYVLDHMYGALCVGGHRRVAEAHNKRERRAVDHGDRVWKCDINALHAAALGELI